MKLLFLFVSAVLLSACSSPNEDANQRTVAVYTAGMDTTLRPQDDFYQYANGGWLKSTAIPPSEHSWSVFDELREKTERECLALLLDASRSQAYPEGSGVRKAIHFFRRAMDSLLAERRGVTPLMPTWNKIALIKTKADLQAYLLDAQAQGDNPLFEIRVRPKLNYSKTHGIFINAVTLGLPDRDLYLSFDAKVKEVRTRYELHIATMMQLAGVPEQQAKKEAVAIVAFETSLAKLFPTPEERLDPTKWNNPRSLPELNRLVPSIKWEEYLNGLNLPVDTVNVGEPTYLREMERSLSSFSMEVVKSFLRWRALQNAAPYLHHALVKESFEFNQKFLRGVERLSPRWQRAYRETNTYFGDAIAKLYVRTRSGHEAIDSVREITNNVRFGMAERIKTRVWLTDSTKERALNKLRAMQLKIGFPEKWHSYAALSINTDTTQSCFFEDVVAARRFHVNENLLKAGKAVDLQEWTMTPHTVGISYNVASNELVIPLALLQAPFFSAQQVDAINYGAFGALIGREIVHAFDNIGTYHDAAGNLQDWLTIDERKSFTLLTQQMVLQQSKTELGAGMFLKATRTMNEDLADLGGLAIALEGLHRARREAPQLGTGNLEIGVEPFFLSWASICRAKYRPEQLLVFTRVCTQSPLTVRALVPLVNLPAFDSAFQVKVGDKLYKAPQDRLEIW